MVLTTEVDYDNSTSGLVADNVQGAIDEVEAKLENHKNNHTPHKLQDLENSRELLWGFEIDINGVLNFVLKVIIWRN